MKRIYRQLKAWLLRLDRRQRNCRFTVVRSEEEHTCPYCGEVFRGNYCPQCGKTPALERTSLKRAMLDFIDQWNLGSNSNTLFRTLRDLLWRPGYLVRDWLGGRRQLYFPPVLTLATTCLILTLVMGIRDVRFTHRAIVEVTPGDSMGLVLQPDSVLDQQITELKTLRADSVEVVRTDSIDDRLSELYAARSIMAMDQLWKDFDTWLDDNFAYKQMFFNLLLIVAFYIVFRKSPNRACTTLPEFFFAQLYIDSGMILISAIWILATGILLNDYIFYPMPNWLAFPLLLVAYRQLFGHSLWGTAWRIALVVLLVNLIGFALIVLYMMGYLLWAGVTDGYFR